MVKSGVSKHKNSKKFVVNFSLSFTNRWLYVFLFFFLVVLLAVGVYSTHYTSVPNPGHGAHNIVVDVGGSEMSLQEAIDDGAFGGGGGGSFVESFYSVDCGGGGCTNSVNMGSHEFCTYSGFYRDNGFYRGCKMTKPGDDWVLEIFLSSGSEGVSWSCYAMCFDYA